MLFYVFSTLYIIYHIPLCQCMSMCVCDLNMKGFKYFLKVFDI